MAMLPTKFQFIWPSGFRGKDCLESTNQKKELPAAAVCNRIGRHRQFLFMIGLFFKSSRKRIGQMYRNLVGSIYGMSSIKIAHFVAIR
jgi:hypothetical protein